MVRPDGSVLVRLSLAATNSSISLFAGIPFHSKPERSPITVTMVEAYAPSYRASIGASPRRSVFTNPVSSVVAMSELPVSMNASAVTSRRVPLA